MKQVIQFLGSIILIAAASSADAQYYFKDIISNEQVANDLAIYKEANIRTIKIKSFESYGDESEGFFCEKRISKDFRKSSLYIRSEMTGVSLMEAYFNEKGKLIRTYDSSAIVVSNNYFYYDKSNRLSKTMSIAQSKDDDYINSITEEHLYIYNENNFPEKMIRIKNKSDSISVLFSLDENNQVSVEKETQNGSKYYYYYDGKGRITDVVHSNEYKEKLIADYLFEYNSGNQLTQMTVTEEGDDNFVTWKYTYENNLRMTERLFSKDRKLMGRFEYEYKK